MLHRRLGCQAADPDHVRVLREEASIRFISLSLVVALIQDVLHFFFFEILTLLC